MLRLNDLTLVGYVNAAFGCHVDGKSHTGLVVMLGGANVLCKSSKQKIVTKDSTEAELVGLSDQIQCVMLCAKFLKGMIILQLFASQFPLTLLPCMFAQIENLSAPL